MHLKNYNNGQRSMNHESGRVNAKSGDCLDSVLSTPRAAIH